MFKKEKEDIYEYNRFNEVNAKPRETTVTYYVFCIPIYRYTFKRLRDGEIVDKHGNLKPFVTDL